MSVVDIRPLKASLREYYKSVRREMSPSEKQRRDRDIRGRVLSVWQYKRCRQLLVYVSTDIEVDTRGLIRRAIEDGKSVAVPRCVPGTRDMEFYYISSVDELRPGTFGVLEPQPRGEMLVTDFSDSVCIVPALCYDWAGYRLGYGGGYYDRFLAEYDGHMIGIAYTNCVRRRLPHGRFDRTVELLVTDRYLRNINDRR